MIAAWAARPLFHNLGNNTKSVACGTFLFCPLFAFNYTRCCAGINPGSCKVTAVLIILAASKRPAMRAWHDACNMHAYHVAPEVKTVPIPLARPYVPGPDHVKGNTPACSKNFGHHLLCSKEPVMQVQNTCVPHEGVGVSVWYPYVPNGTRVPAIIFTAALIGLKLSVNRM
eukprot:scaffold284715_cov17-Tisochrysis_lutea.AAC.2